MVSFRPIEHIDRKSLYTSLPSRIAYLHSFLDFSSRDIDALQSGSKYIKQLIPAVVNIVYKKLLQYDITARAFQTRSTAYEGPIDEDVLDEESPQIIHRKSFLTAYLRKICADPNRMEFWEYLDKVGMMHVGLGRAHPLHIEYIHIGACLSFIQDVFTEAILSHPRLSLNRKIAIVRALGKVIWIQNDLFAKWYVEDGEEFRGSEEMEVVLEKEGWLHGVKILDLEGDSGEDRDMHGDMVNLTPGKEEKRPREKFEGVCPFAGVSNKAQGVESVESLAGKVDELKIGGGVSSKADAEHHATTSKIPIPAHSKRDSLPDMSNGE